MIRQSTLDKWKPIIDGYDKKQCSLKEILASKISILFSFSNIV